MILSPSYIFSMLLYACFWFEFVSAVTCNHCKDSIPGCKGGNACPLNKTVLANAAAIIGGTAAAISLVGLIPHRLMGVFPRSAVDRLVQLFKDAALNAPFDPAGKDYGEIYDAYTQGKIGKNEATSAMVRLMRDAEDADARSPIAACVTALSSGAGGPVAGSESSQLVGPYRFIVGTILKFISTRGNTVTLGASSSSGGGSSQRSLETSLVAPPREEDFYEMLNLFTMF